MCIRDSAEVVGLEGAGRERRRAWLVGDGVAVEAVEDRIAIAARAVGERTARIEVGGERAERDARLGTDADAGADLLVAAVAVAAEQRRAAGGSGAICAG